MRSGGSSMNPCKASTASSSRIRRLIRVLILAAAAAAPPARLCAAGAEGPLAGVDAALLDRLFEALRADSVSPARRPAALAPETESFLLRYAARTGQREAFRLAARSLAAQREACDAASEAWSAANAVEAYQAGKDLEAARAAGRRLDALLPLDLARMRRDAQGPAISALAKGFAVLEEPRYLAAAQKAARALPARPPAGLGFREAAFLVQGFLDLYAADFDPDWLDRADAFARVLRRGLPLRGLQEAEPSLLAARGVAVQGFLRLAHLSERPEYRQAAEAALLQFRDAMRDFPRAHPALLSAADLALAKPRQIVLAGELDDPATRELLRLARSRFSPGETVIVLPEGPVRERMVKRLPLLKGMTPIAGKTTAYICVRFACRLPTNDLKVAARLLAEGDE